jgi:Arabinose efflux permease
MFSREWRYLLLIIVIFIAACIETDIYLPAFTDMMIYFSVSEEKIQSLLTWNFIGICVSGPLYGPISDAIGRKKPLMVALGLFFLGSVFTLFAQDFNFMLAGRILQGLGSGGCFTLGTTVLFDAFKEKEAIQALNRINSIVPFIMAAAPMLGGYLNSMYGFRSNFMAIAFCVLASLLVCIFFFDETLPKEKRSPLNFRRILGDFKKVSLSLPFWQTTAIVSLLFAGYLAFLSGISVLFVMEYDVSKENLPYYQAALLGAWLVANLSCRQSINKWGIPWVKKVGTILFVAGGLVLVAAAWATPESAVLLTAAMALYSFGVNWTQGLYFPEGMALFPDAKGVTASLLTSIRLLLTAVVVGLTSMLYNATIYPIVAVVFGIVVVVLATILLYERKRSERSVVQGEQV